MSTRYGYSSSSSGCDLCNSYTRLSTPYFSRASNIAVAVFNGISALVLLVCFLAAFRFVWTKRERIASARTAAYAVAAFSAFMYFIMTTIEDGLAIGAVRVRYTIVIYFIFIDLFQRLAELFILGVVFSIIQGRVLSKLLFPFKWLALIVVGLLTTAGFGIYVARTAIQLKDGRSYSAGVTVDRLDRDGLYVNIAYLAIYFVSTLILLGFSVFFILSDRSRTSLMLILVAAALSVRTVIALAYDSWAANTYYGSNYIYSRSRRVQQDFSLANAFIYLFMTWAVFAGVAVIGLIRENISRGKHMDGMAPVTEQRHAY